jgi:large conductance mechanosensitive channel|nr:MAG: large conductance mechanosensitive channel protein MscL [Actinomycetota bacterium]
MLKEFRDFALKGNLLDIAVGFILGAAFGTLVDSLVADIITPLIAGIAGEPNFSNLVLKVGDAEIAYGNFLNAAISFLLVAAALFFFIVKPVNALRARLARGEEVVDEAPAPEIALLAEIRDELRRRP